MPITFDDQLKVIDAHIERERKWIAENRGRYASSFIARKDVEMETWTAIRETVREARQAKQMTGMGGKPVISELDEIEDALKKFDGDPPYDGRGNLVCGDGIFAKSIEHRFGASIKELRRKVQERKR